MTLKPNYTICMQGTIIKVVDSRFRGNDRNGYRNDKRVQGNEKRVHENDILLNIPGLIGNLSLVIPECIYRESREFKRNGFPFSREWQKVVLNDRGNWGDRRV
jgi:hypothetical protein